VKHFTTHKIWKGL